MSESTRRHRPPRAPSDDLHRVQSSAAAPPSNTPPSGGAATASERRISLGIDTLEVFFDAEVREDALAILRGARTEARAPRRISLGGREWVLEPGPLHVDPGYFLPFHLHAGGLATAGLSDAPGASFPTVLLKIDCKRLWMSERDHGVDAAFSAWAELHEWVRSIAHVRSASVRKIDLAADVIGWQLGEDDRARFVGMATRRERPSKRRKGIAAHFGGAELETLTFKPGASRSACVYDKRRESKNGKSWFEPLWGSPPPSWPVWRVEARFRGKALDRELGTRDPDRVSRCLGDLWAAVVGAPTANGGRSGWLRLTNAGDRRRETRRRKTDPVWRELQALVWPIPSDHSSRASPLAATTKAQDACRAFIRTLRGMLTSAGAELGLTDIRDVCDAVLASGDLDAMAEEVRTKALSKNLSLLEHAWPDVIREARAIVERTTGPIPDATWRASREVLAAVATGVVRTHDPHPWTTAARLVREPLEEAVPLVCVPEGEVRVARAPESEAVWDRWRAHVAMMLAVSFVDPSPRDPWAIFAT